MRFVALPVSPAHRPSHRPGPAAGVNAAWERARLSLPLRQSAVTNLVCPDRKRQASVTPPPTRRRVLAPPRPRAPGTALRGGFPVPPRLSARGRGAGAGGGPAGGLVAAPRRLLVCGPGSGGALLAYADAAPQTAGEGRRHRRSGEILRPTAAAPAASPLRPWRESRLASVIRPMEGGEDAASRQQRRPFI